MISVGRLQSVHALRRRRLEGRSNIPARAATPLFIQPEVEMILSHSGAFPLCMCVFGVVWVTDGALLSRAALGHPIPELLCTAEPRLTEL